jgi:hypothetical protein
MSAPFRSPLADYRWRLTLSKKDWVRLAGLLAGAVTYPNFKTAVAQAPDQKAKHEPYLEVWSVMHRFQAEQESEGG